ncbi:HSP20-like chaperone [Limtongia smithiae]|uniref:HSP20-like chaperone n=1 Tax=Limtongia smithiae TaxID=1125753 RepID=UPI0034CE12FB
MSLSRFFGPSIPLARDLMMPSRMLRLLDTPYFNMQPFEFPTPLASSLADTAFTRTPTFDVKETDKEFVLQGELPGVDKKNLNLEFVDPQTLSVRGTIEKTQEYNAPPSAEASATSDASTAVAESSDKTVTKSSSSAPATYWATERVYGEFSRAFKFPTPVDSEKVTASLKNGILSVVVPKMNEAAGKKKIELVADE